MKSLHATIFSALLTAWLLTADAFAHQVDKIDHATTLEIELNGNIQATFTIYWGDMIAFQVRKEKLDQNHNGQIDKLEEGDFLLQTARAIPDNLELTIQGKKIVWEIVAYSINLMGETATVPKPFYLQVVLKATYPTLSQLRHAKVAVNDGLAIPDNLLGNNMIELKLKELKLFTPQPHLSSINPQAALGVTFDLAPAVASSLVIAWGGNSSGTAVATPFSPLPDSTMPTTIPAPPTPATTAPVPIDRQAASADHETGQIDKFLHDLRRGKASLWTMLTALFICFWIGVGHAVSPGHGKTLVAAYLIGSQGRIRDAVFLGGVVTISHVSSVIILGLLMWGASHIFPQEIVLPWLTAISGVLILLLGIAIIFRKPHDHGQSHSHGHDHDHDHDHNHGHEHHRQQLPRRDSKRFWWELLWLGISGGMVPCPSALVILLTAIGLGIPLFGIMLVIAFSIGLALVLMGIGILMVVTKNFALALGMRSGPKGRWLIQLLPKISGTLITVWGVAIVLKGLQMAGFITLHG